MGEVPGPNGMTRPGTEFPTNRSEVRKGGRRGGGTGSKGRCKAVAGIPHVSASAAHWLNLCWRPCRPGPHWSIGTGRALVPGTAGRVSSLSLLPAALSLPLDACRHDATSGCLLSLLWLFGLCSQTTQDGGLQRNRMDTGQKSGRLTQTWHKSRVYRQRRCDRPPSWRPGTHPSRELLEGWNATLRESIGLSQNRS